MRKRINKQFFLDRLEEPSTWQGMIGLLTALGVSIAPDVALKIIAAGTALAGLIGTFTADKR